MQTESSWGSQTTWAQARGISCVWRGVGGGGAKFDGPSMQFYADFGGHSTNYSGTPLIRTLWNKDTSINRTVAAGPNSTFVHYWK